MKKCTQYSAEFKEKLLAKAFSSNASSIVELARKANIPYPTLYAWVYKSKNRKKTKSDETSSMKPKDKTAEAKLRAVSDTFQMTEAEKSAYCRQHGLYIHQLDEWKEQMLSGFEESLSKKQKSEHRQYIIEIKQLKKELDRKEKALAETSALLVLKKKANLIWGDGEED